MTDKDPFRKAENQTRCPECTTLYGWNDEDGLEGQICSCGYVFHRADDLDFDARYAAEDSYGRIAFYLKDFKKEYPPEEDLWELVCENTNPDHEHGEECWVYDEEPELIVNKNFVIAVMVGDDREHIIDVDELTKLDDDDYCSVCGQIGCTADQL